MIRQRLAGCIDGCAALACRSALVSKVPPFRLATKQIVIMPFLANTLVTCLRLTYRQEHKAQLVIGTQSRSTCQSQRLNSLSPYNYLPVLPYPPS